MTNGRNFIKQLSAMGAASLISGSLTAKTVSRDETSINAASTKRVNSTVTSASGDKIWACL